MLTWEYRLFRGVPSSIRPRISRGTDSMVGAFCEDRWNPVADCCVTVSEDLVRYMDYATSGQNNFLVNDPVWAEDFAPNGRS